MKIIEYHGGLGNQLFEYTYFKYLKTLFPNEKFYSYCPKRATNVHYGLEINKWFDVELANTSLFTDIIGFISFWGIRIMRRINVSLPWVSDDFHLCDNKIYHEGWYQNSKYFRMVGGINFRKDLNIGETNKDILKLMESTNSVAIHIRRGDYLEAKNFKSVGGICTKDYYEKAIMNIESILDEPTYFFFSDDPDYVNKTYKLPRMFIVSHNIGSNSYLDMYLMAHAKNMILANSTFSCWAAYLNTNVNTVICPSRWNKKMNLNLSLDSWIKINV